MGRAETATGEQKLPRRKHRSKVLRLTLGRHYRHMKNDSLRGCVSQCVAKKLEEY
ncbi:uncharacterized protein PITG_02938 [Phytophthora infestans T30-4]|uniref:Uncharacterized protein n=1 Tax=Phytophthora infestans (strain T30-4) TaxID=403677 RepID=D0MXJ3_PHYIT|nr:uncharacterized protein PITG_02938 [Phytophthora infestans T30-4]EEY64356.1 hypothetical protein PITG_02938 [Phytophthora infestans T30-4]|eukprot:XP_002907792.1 hypothetical protein PITG_02938 [Phytophthora infestans T30-4]